MTRATFATYGPATPSSPVVLSVPHAGRDYPDAHNLLRHTPERLRALEDRHADRLADVAIAGGAAAIVARLPRLWIDLNRSESELDPAMVVGLHGGGLPLSLKARGGLGLIPRSLSDVGQIWRTGLTADDVARRIAVHYRPYHQTLSAMLARARARFGVAMLVDLHSMPPLTGPGSPQIVLGNRFGATCGLRLTAAAEAVFRRAGYETGANVPYAGGYIVSHHADRFDNVHALQVEIDRALYLDASFDQPSAGLPKLQEIIASLIQALADQLSDSAMMAAE